MVLQNEDGSTVQTKPEVQRMAPCTQHLNCVGFNVGWAILRLLLVN